MRESSPGYAYFDGAWIALWLSDVLQANIFYAVIDSSPHVDVCQI